MDQSKVAETLPKTNQDPTPGISREAAKATIDAVVARLTFLLDNFFSKSLSALRPQYRSEDSLFEGLTFILFESQLTLEKLYFQLYPELKTEWSYLFADKRISQPIWDTPDLSCKLFTIISALDFILTSSFGRLEDREKLIQRGFTGLMEIINDVQFHLCDCASAIEKELRVDLIETGSNLLNDRPEQT